MLRLGPTGTSDSNASFVGASLPPPPDPATASHSYTHTQTDIATATSSALATLSASEEKKISGDNRVTHMPSSSASPSPGSDIPAKFVFGEESYREATLITKREIREDYGIPTDSSYGAIISGFVIYSKQTEASTADKKRIIQCAIDCGNWLQKNKARTINRDFIESETLHLRIEGLALRAKGLACKAIYYSELNIGKP